MVKLFEIAGLTYPEMVDVTTYILLAIAFGVFTGKCLYGCFCGIADVIWTVLGFLFRLIRKHLRKHFPNVRKKTERGKNNDIR